MLRAAYAALGSQVSHQRFLQDSSRLNPIDIGLLMQRVCLPTAHVALLRRRKPKPIRLSHVGTAGSDAALKHANLRISRGPPGDCLKTPTFDTDYN